MMTPTTATRHTMVNHERILCLLSAGLLAASVALPVGAQQVEQQPDGAAVVPKVKPPEPEDPSVAAILRTKPSTPAELARAARVLADLGRPDLGRQFLQRVIDAKLGPQQLAELADKVGSATFLNMAAREEMQPQARQLADAILAAADQSLKDPKRIAGLIQKLQDPSPAVRAEAVAGLQRAGAAAVGPLVEALADPNRAAEHPNVRAALVEIRFHTVGPLLGLLEAPDPRLVAQAIETLAGMGARQSVIYLLRPYCSEASPPAVRTAAGAGLRRLVGRTPSRREAVGLLSRRASAYFDRRQPIREDVDGRVELWRWDEAKRQCVSKRYPADEAASAMAARLARDAYALESEDPEIRQLYLAATLEAAAYEAGLERPLPDGKGTAAAEAAGFGAGVIEDVMQQAIAGEHVPAATAAARILGKIGTADELLRQGPQPAPLVQATQHPDRRLRMAAIDAVIRLQPTRPYPGSSRIPESLAFFAASGGVRRALVAGPRTEDSRRLAGMLAGMGLEVDTAGTGRELVRLVVGSPDYELVLIDAVIDRPPAELLLQELRRDCRGATLRVGLMAGSGQLERAERIARRDPLTLAFSRPHSDESFAAQMAELTSLAPQAFVDQAERQRQAAEALDRLAELSGPENKLYNVRRVEGPVLTALYTPGLNTKAAAVLGNLATAGSQQALVELASRWTQPPEVRQAAVKALRRSIEAGGILLTRQQILRQYDRYNQSEDLDVPTQQILGLILDCIEAPTEPVQAEKRGGPEKTEGGKQKAERA